MELDLKVFLADIIILLHLFIGFVYKLTHVNTAVVRLTMYCILICSLKMTCYPVCVHGCWCVCACARVCWCACVCLGCVCWFRMPGACLVKCSSRPLPQRISFSSTSGSGKAEPACSRGLKCCRGSLGTGERKEGGELMFIHSTYKYVKRNLAISGIFAKTINI